MATAQVQDEVTSSSPRAKLLETLADHWWLLVLRGITATFLGVLTLISPGLVLLTLILMWAVYILVDVALAGAVFHRGIATATSAWWLTMTGLVSIAGVAALAWPALTGRLPLVLIAAWAIAVGAIQTWGALKLREDISGEWLLGFRGLVSILLGFIVLASPGADGLALAGLFAIFIILFGLSEIGLALEVVTHDTRGSSLF